MRQYGTTRHMGEVVGPWPFYIASIKRDRPRCMSSPGRPITIKPIFLNIFQQ
jgi:hypothetical protein